MNRTLALLCGALALGLPALARAQTLGGPAGVAGAPALNVFGPAAPAAGSSDGGLSGGVSTYLIKPYFQDNVAFRTTVAPATPTSLVTDTGFHFSYDPAYSIWAGWSAPGGLGLRARYFYYSQSADPITFTPDPLAPVNPAPGFLPLSTGGTILGSPGAVLTGGFGTDVLTFGSNLTIDAVDVEATRSWQGSGWSILASAGGRYQVLNQSYHGRLTNGGGGAAISEIQTLDSTRNFNGGGPTLAVFANMRLADSNLSVYGSLRGAFLVGVNTEQVQFVQIVTDPTGLTPAGSFTLTPQASRVIEHTLTVAEAELGVQYDIRQYGAFVRAGVVNHTYFDAGNATQSTGNMSLFGAQFSVGIRY